MGKLRRLGAPTWALAYVCDPGCTCLICQLEAPGDAGVSSLQGLMFDAGTHEGQLRDSEARRAAELGKLENFAPGGNIPRPLRGWGSKRKRRDY